MFLVKVSGVTRGVCMIKTVYVTVCMDSKRMVEVLLCNHSDSETITLVSTRENKRIGYHMQQDGLDI